MQKFVGLIILLLLGLAACGPVPGQERGDGEAEPQTIPTATPLPTPAPASTAPAEQQKGSDAAETSPLPTPLLEIGSTSPLATPTGAPEVEPGDQVAPLPGTEALVAEAKRLLAASSEIQATVDQIALLSIESVDWSDSSLGCPQPGQFYAQMITPGYLLVLGAAGQEFEFHTDRANRVILCLSGDEGKSSGGPSRGEVALPPGAVIDYHREGGIAGLIEGWTIFSDGRVVSLDGTEGRLSPQVVTELLTLIREAGFFEMAPSYIPQNVCCDRFSYRLTVQHEGQIYTVNTVDAAPDMPPELDRILGEIDQVLRAGGS